MGVKNVQEHLKCVNSLRELTSKDQDDGDANPTTHGSQDFIQVVRSWFAHLREQHLEQCDVQERSAGDSLKDTVGNVSSHRMDIADSDSKCQADGRGQGEDRVEDEDLLFVQLGHDEGQTQGEGHDPLVEHHCQEQAHQGAQSVLREKNIAF